MRPASQRFFKHRCIYLRIVIISYLATFLCTNSLSVLMCRKAVNQTAVFDAVDHNILLQRLQQTFGVDGNAHRWFRSYLVGRSVGRTQYGPRPTFVAVLSGHMCCAVCRCRSDPCWGRCMLFILYTFDLIQLIEAMS